MCLTDVDVPVMLEQPKMHLPSMVKDLRHSLNLFTRPKPSHLWDFSN